MIGKNLSNYRILEKLGAGGQGTVYKATDTKLGRTVVIKVLPPELTAKEANLKRFEREARLASSLDHPNICTIFDLDEAEGLHFIAMQHVEGRNVRQLVGGHPLELKSALADRHSGGRCPGRRARSRHHSSRYQIRQCHGVALRSGEDFGFWPGEVTR